MTCRPILEIDIVKAFNSAARQASFDTFAGTSSQDYNQGRVNRGDSLPSFLGLLHLFGYWRTMHDTAATFLYVNADGQRHHIEGSTGGQQGDSSPTPAGAWPRSTAGAWPRSTVSGGGAMSCAFFCCCVHVGVLEQETPKWRFPFPKSKNRLRESKVKRSVFTYMSEHETLGIESLGVPIHVYACICERFFLYRDFLPNKNPKLQAGHCFDVGG